jgi:hypothetical protein
MGFILNKQPEAIAAFDWKPDEMGKRTMDVEPGLLPELLPGQEFQEFNAEPPEHHARSVLDDRAPRRSRAV